MKIGFRTKLMIIMLLFSFLLTLTMTYIDQQRLTATLIEERNIQKSLVEDNIISALTRIDSVFHVIDRDLESKMRNFSFALGQKYKENPDFDSWDFEALKAEFDGLDIYIIDSDAYITHSSFELDIGMNFASIAPKFVENLARIREEGIFVADHMDNETLTGRLRKYSYYPTHDGKFVIELGYVLTDNELFRRLNFLNTIEELIQSYAIVDDITVYSSDGTALGKSRPEGEALLLDEQFAEVLQKLDFASGEKMVFRNKTHSNIVHEFIAYSIDEENREDLQYAKHRIVEIVYNEDEVNQFLERNRDIMVLQLALTFLIALLISYIIARLVSRPMYLAFHDALTDLSNRTAFETKLQECLRKNRRSNSLTAVLLVDLDNFKPVNDTLGHDNGDLLLVEVASRIKSALDGNGVAARLGGDEFAVLLSRIERQEQAEETAECILAELRSPFLLQGADIIEQFRVTASIGIAIAPIHGMDPHTLAKHADLAMYRAKKSGKSKCRVFEPSLDRPGWQQHDLEQ